MSIFKSVPTYFWIYKVADKQTARVEFVKECKTKGKAVEWIHDNGEKDGDYNIIEVFKKN